jgi:hypothetical protein
MPANLNAKMLAKTQQKSHENAYKTVKKPYKNAPESAYDSDTCTTYLGFF